IFIRYGWHNGVSDGELALTFRWETELDLIRSGPSLHKLHGYVDDVIIDNLKYDQVDDLEAIYVSWYNSFEVYDYLKCSNQSDQSGCHKMCGYASGYLLTVLKRPYLLVKQNVVRWAMITVKLFVCRWKNTGTV